MVFGTEYEFMPPPIGEMSDAMETVVKRHHSEIRSVPGAFGSAYEGGSPPIGRYRSLRARGGQATDPGAIEASGQQVTEISYPRADI